MKTVIVDEASWANPEDLHGYLKEELGFPSYYGGNLAALSDCLEDVDAPTRILIRRQSHRLRSRWFGKVCRVIIRCAVENADLRVDIEDAEDGHGGCASGVKEENMETMRLDLSEDATRQEILRQLMEPVGEEAAHRIESAVCEMRESGLHYHDVGEVSAAIEGLSVNPEVKRDALGVYEILAQAEAQVHGCAVEDTHFHEVGNAEAVANVMAVCLAVEELGRPRIVASAVQTGEGTVECAHGLLDIPAPATAAILARGIPVESRKRPGEWCTPTSAAIILHFVDAFE